MQSSSEDKAEILDQLFAVIEARRVERPSGSYVVSLLDGGVEAIEAKVLEEAQEVVDAALNESDEAVAHEAADLLFHLWVLLAARGISMAAIQALFELVQTQQDIIEEQGVRLERLEGLLAD